MLIGCVVDGMPNTATGRSLAPLLRPMRRSGVHVLDPILETSQNFPFQAGATTDNRGPPTPPTNSMTIAAEQRSGIQGQTAETRWAICHPERRQENELCAPLASGIVGSQRLETTLSLRTALPFVDNFLLPKSASAGGSAATVRRRGLFGSGLQIKSLGQAVFRQNTALEAVQDHELAVEEKMLFLELETADNSETAHLEY